jgi:hypothetical protein
LLFTSLAVAQGIQITGGDLLLMGAAGVKAKLSFVNSETAVGGGILSGHVYGGVSEKFHYRRV